MQKQLARILKIYPNELTSTFLFSLLIFFWSFSTASFRDIVDGFLLSHVQNTDIATSLWIAAIVLLTLSIIVLRATRYCSSLQFLKYVTISSTFLIFLFSFITYFSSPPPFFFVLAKTSARVMLVAFLAMTWTFIDEYHDLQSAKRVYTIYNTIYFLGITINGLFINILLKKYGHLLITSISIICILLGFTIVNKIVAYKRTVEEDTFEEPLTDRYSIRQTISLILKSPLTLLFLSLSCFQESLFAITDINFLVSMKSKISGDISIFLSGKRSWIALSNIIFGLFIYPHIIKRMGLKNSVLITPVFMFFVYIFWIRSDSMTTAMLALIASDGFTLVCEDNNLNLLTKASPSKIRSKIRIINDSLFEPLGFLLSTSVFLFLPSHLGIFLGFYVSIVVFVIASFVRYFYPSAIFMNLKNHLIQFETSLKSLFKNMGSREKNRNINHLLKFLQSEDEKDILLAIEGLLMLEQKKYIPRILMIANNLSASAKKKLIKIWDKSCYRTEPHWIASLHNWLNSKDESSDSIMLYLARFGLLQRDTFKDLESDKLTLRACAILTLQTCIDAKTIEESSIHLSTAKRELELLLGSSDTKEILMALSIMLKTSGKDSFELALFLLFHHNIKVKALAAKLVSMHIDNSYGYLTEHIINIVKENTSTKFRIYCFDILQKIADPRWISEIFEISLHSTPLERRHIEKSVEAMGLKTVPFLLQILKDKSKNDKCRTLAVKVLARLAPPQLQSKLSFICEEEIKKAFFYFYYGNVMATCDPILKEVLITGFYSKIDFLIHLLATHGEIEEPEVLSLSLRSSSIKIKSHAIESLETSCDNTILNTILPIIDTSPLHDKIKHCTQTSYCDTTLTLYDVLLKLDTTPSLINKIMANRFKAQYNISGWKRDLIRHMTEEKEPFHIFAYELLNQYTENV